MVKTNRHFRDLVIRASAGTGKTFQLSNRLIGLAAADEPLDSLLATTFTRKAAGEILDRVLQRLGDAVRDRGPLEKLSAHIDADPALSRERCLDMLANLVRALHRLRIGTLDSFFIQVARSFSLELGLPHGWQIVDELDDQRLRVEAIRAIVRDGSTRDTVRLMNLLTKGDATRSVSDQIAALVNRLHDVYLEAPSAAWQSLTRRKPLDPAKLTAAMDATAAAQLPADRRFAKARADDLERARNEQWEEFLQFGLAKKILDGTRQYCRKPIPDGLADAYQPLLTHAQAVVINQIANQTEATEKLLERFDAAYQRLKVAHRAMRFDDITRALGQERVAARIDEVLYRLDAELRHLLLDEFQDTSPLQWRALQPFARRVTGGGSRRSFFCVGDVKQAIYGWRGGVAEIFDAVTDELAGIDTAPLNKSQRSSPVVIDTVNRVFESLAGNPALQNYVDAARLWSRRFIPHTTARTDRPGYCRMLVAPRADAGVKQRVVTLEYAAREIKRLSQACPAHTIGVLVRDNDAVARLIYELRRLAVNASEEGGVSLVNSPAVQVLLSLLTLADHPGDTVARFHLAHSPLAGELGLDNPADTTATWRISAEIRQRLMADGYGLVLHGWLEKLLPSCARRDRNRLLQLLEIAYAYDARATARVDDFVALVRQQKVEDPTSAGVRVMTVHQAKGLQFDMVVLPQLDVRLKGQPAPLVVGRPTPTGSVERVCRYVSQKLRTVLPGEFAKLFEDDQRRVVEESLCVLYVALTRAVHALHLIVAPPHAREKTIPATMAGILRSALAADGSVDPGATIYEHGDPDWFRTLGAQPTPVAAAESVAEGALTIRLAQGRTRFARNLDRRSPSALEGGARVDLAQRLRLDSNVALDRGTLLHAWFELIEWLEDDIPNDGALRAVAKRLALGRVDLPATIAQFRSALGGPAIGAILRRATYEQPAAEGACCTVHADSRIERPRWQVWRERPFAVREENTILSGTIDRLVVLYDEERPVAADVIDFKSDTVGSDQPEMVAARVEVYRPQLDAYRRAVAKLFRLDPSRISARLAFVTAGMVRAV